MIHKLQKYRDDSARAIGYKHDPAMIQAEKERDAESTLKAYSATWPKDIHESSIPHRNYIPKS